MPSNQILRSTALKILKSVETENRTKNCALLGVFYTPSPPPPPLPTISLATLDLSRVAEPDRFRSAPASAPAPEETLS